MDSQENECDGVNTQHYSVEYRRLLRKEYRELNRATEENQDELREPEKLVEKVQAHNALLQGVVLTREAALDSASYRNLSTIGRAQVVASQGELVQFDTGEYIERLITFMSRGDSSQLNWKALGDKARPVLKRVPKATFLLGALELQAVRKKKEPQKRQKNDSAGVVTKPKEVLSFEEEEETTTRNVLHLLKCLKDTCADNGEVHFFKFLVDPQSFSHTVENMFYLSFLVKDGRVGIRIVDGVPVIYFPEDVNNAKQSTKTVKNQAIIALSMAQWQRAIQKYDIVESAISRCK